MKKLFIMSLTGVALVAAIARLFIVYGVQDGVISRTPFGQAVDAWLFSYRAPLSIHIMGAATYMVIVPFQLSGGDRRSRHRLLGRVAAVAVIVSMLIALPLSLLFSLENPATRFITFLGAVLILMFVFLALRAIRTGAVARHRSYMLAAYVLMLGATAERIWLTVFYHLHLMSPEALLSLGVPLVSSGPIIIAFKVAFGRKAVSS